MNSEKQRKFIINFIYFGIIIFLAIVILKYGLGLLAPFIAGFIIAYFLKNIAKKITDKTNLPYKPVVMVLVLIFYGTIGLIITVLFIKVLTSSADLISAIPSIYTLEIEPELSHIFMAIEKAVFKLDVSLMAAIDEFFDQFISSLGELITGLSVELVSLASGYASSLPGLFVKLLLVIISTFFIAGDYDILMGFVSRQFSDSARSLLLKIKEYVVGTLFVCIRSYAIIMTVTFVELSIGLTVIGIEKGVLIAFLISIFDILPVLGTGGIMIPWTILEALQGNYKLAISLLAVYIIVTVIRNIIEPKIVGSQLGLHPVVTLAAMFVGVQLFGIIGLFGFPIFLSLLKYLNDTKTIAIFK